MNIYVLKINYYKYIFPLKICKQQYRVNGLFGNNKKKLKNNLAYCIDEITDIKNYSIIQLCPHTLCGYLIPLVDNVYSTINHKQ